MTRKVYALFVGIDEYTAPVRPLNGCVNDVSRMRTLFEERITGAQDEFVPMTLANGDASRGNIIAAFREHLGQAGAEDVALFYYSGHGSQEPAPPEFWHLEPDRLNETLVCVDSRLPGGWDLADKELSQLIAEVAASGAHVAVILDCCHSGSGTRDALDDVEAGVSVRLQSTDRRTRPIDSYILSQEQADVLFGDKTGQGGANWIALPQGRHILMAACSDDETAKETYLGGERRGVFSYFLQDTLEGATGALTYRNLFKRIQTLVPTRVQRQTPVIEATDVQDLEQPFLGGAIPEREPFFTLRYQDHRWVIDGGAVHGIIAPIGAEKTVLAVFPSDVVLDQLSSLQEAVGEAQVDFVLTSESEVTVTTRDGSPLSKTEVYQAVVVAQPLPPLLVAFEGDGEALELVRNALASAGPGAQPSLLVREGSLEEAEYRLRAMPAPVEDGGKAVYRISRKADAYPLAVDTEGFDPGSAVIVVRRLEHVARWQKIADLTNKSSSIREDAISLEFFHVGQDDEPVPVGAGEELRFEYRPPYGLRDYPRLQMKLTNTSDQTYYCMLLDLAQDYSVYTGLLPEGIIRLQPGEEAWATVKDRRGRLHTAIPVTIPDELYQQGITRIRDIIKLIVSTDKSDASLLAMGSLPVTADRSVTRSLPAQMSTLNRLMERVHTRGVGLFPEDDEPYSDWRTLEFSSVIVRPLQAQEVAQPGSTTTLADGVTLSAHPQLKAQVRLGALNTAARDLGNLLTPALFRDHPDVFLPLEFTASRGGEPGLAVLELDGVADHTVVSAQYPLVLTVDGALAEKESILPYAYDGDFFLPLGYARSVDGHTEIRLEHLPAPTSAGQRDLKGSIKIMFQKIAADVVGLDYDYPQLAVATVADDGTVTYEAAPSQVRQQVDGARRILLYIHGLFGDTEGMVASAVAAGVDDAGLTKLAQHYDLILAFDYESINTPIEETAIHLKQRLGAVGLGPNHGKTLHLVAQSLGGLAARWYVEREGGNQVVQHLVTLGAPHKGTPWPKIHDWASTLLVLGLNGLSSVVWPVKIAATLIKATEAVDVTADQIGPNSTFIKLLAAASDPGIAITALAGNTSIPSAATQVQAGEADSRLALLLTRLEQMRLLEKAAGLAFFGRPNDMAVSVDSALGLPAGHSSVTTAEIACDHMSFFNTSDSLQRLADALRS
jgi:hypothetical protein